MNSKLKLGLIFLVFIIAIIGLIFMNNDNPWGTISILLLSMICYILILYYETLFGVKNE